MCKALDRRTQDVMAAEDWYDGNHPIPAPPANTFPATDREARIAFDNLSRLAITNMLPPIVDTPASKLRVEGIRFSKDAPRDAADTAWAILQRNHFDSDSDLLIHTAFRTGSTFALVWVDAAGQATITAEDPTQCIVKYAAGSRRQRAAGLKRWVGFDGYDYANLYLPNEVYKFRSRQAAGSPLQVQTSWTAGQGVYLSDSWEPRQIDGEAWPMVNPYGFVTLIEGRVNTTLRPAMYGGGKPEFAKQLTLQRQINANTMNMLVTAEHQAFRQRWVVGWAPPVDENGNPDRMTIMKASAAALSIFNGRNPEESQNIRTGEYGQADFRPFLDINGSIIKAMASTSMTPPYAFLIGDMINVAADALARIDGQHTTKVRAHARNLGEFVEEITRAALLVEGRNDLAADTQTSTIWAEIAERTATEQAALAMQMKDAGVPREEVFAAFPEVDQQTAARWERQATANDLRAAALAPPAPQVP